MSLEYLFEVYTKLGVRYFNLWSYDGELIEKLGYYDHYTGKFKKSITIIKAPVVNEGKIYKTQRYFEDGLVFHPADKWPDMKNIFDEHGITNSSKPFSVKTSSKAVEKPIIKPVEKFFVGKPRFTESDEPIRTMQTDTIPIRLDKINDKNVWVTEDGLQFEDDNGEIGEPINLE
jgi:hypothetical protein